MTTNAPARKQRRASFGLRLLLVGISICFALAIFEIGCRVESEHMLPR